MRVSGQTGFSDWKSSELIWNSAAESNRITVVICFRFIPHFIFNYFKFLTIGYILNQNKHTKSHKNFMPFFFLISLRDFGCIAVSREFIIVYPEYSENRNNRLKKKKVFFSSPGWQVLLYQILPLMFFLFLPLSSVLFSISCGTKTIWSRCSHKENSFLPFTYWKRDNWYTDRGIYCNERPLNSDFSAEES